MPEPDVPDAPEDDEDIPNEFWADLTAEESRRRKSKIERWRVEDKVVEPDTK